MAKKDQGNMKTFKLINENDANEEIELMSNDPSDAMYEALEVLGWMLVEHEDEEELANEAEKLISK